MIRKLKYGFHHPKEALLYLLSPQKYRALEAEKFVAKGEAMERNLKPNNPLEECMIKPTGIHEHLATLYMLTVELNLRTIVELGTRRGESTIALLSAAKEIGGKVYSIDIDPCLVAKERIKTLGLQEHWVFIQGDDLKVEWETPIDHLFIDTTHMFDQTLKELEKWEPFVKHGGIITIHDIVTFPEELQAINSYIKNRRDLRLYKYFNNFGLAVIFKRKQKSDGDYRNV